jgi:hypothetical protein
LQSAGSDQRSEDGLGFPSYINVNVDLQVTALVTLQVVVPGQAILYTVSASGLGRVPRKLA